MRLGEHWGQVFGPAPESFSPRIFSHSQAGRAAGVDHEKHERQQFRDGQGHGDDRSRHRCRSPMHPPKGHEDPTHRQSDQPRRHRRTGHQHEHHRMPPDRHTRCQRNDIAPPIAAAKTRRPPAPDSPPQAVDPLPSIAFYQIARYHPLMLRRLLAGLAILSLVLGAAVLIFWWRGYRHVDHFAVGSLNDNRTEFTSQAGSVMVSRSQSVGGMIMTQSTIYPYRSFSSAFLIVPAFWLAITIRAKLPRPRQTTARENIKAKLTTEAQRHREEIHEPRISQIAQI